MPRSFLSWSVMAILFLGCASAGTGDSPVSPLLKPASEVQSVESQTNLWGYYDVHVDIENGEVGVVPSRSLEFTVNVVKFINSSPAGMSVHFNGTHPGSGYVDIDLDVTINHPFDNKPEFNGYDVRGIFIGNGSNTLSYGSAALMYAGSGDQLMHDYGEVVSDPHAGLIGNPDGYTRWWNPSEFTSPTIFGYVPGNVASKGYTATATLNPYKYFADGLGVEDDAAGFLGTTTDSGVFSSGAENTRNYYLRFPVPTSGIKFSYAITADWTSTTVHPSNTPEAVIADVTITPDLYYSDPSDNGGELILDFTLYGWNDTPDAIYIESSVLSAPYALDPTEMTPTASGTNWNTYHTGIVADNITGTDGNEFWIITEYSSEDYKNPANIPNLAGDSPLAAFFRYDLEVSPTSLNQPPIVDSGVTGNDYPSLGSTEQYTVVAHDPNPGDIITYAWTVTEQSTGDPVPNYDGVPGDSAGHLDVDWQNVVDAVGSWDYEVACTVTDGKSSPVDATTLIVFLQCIAPKATSMEPSWGQSGNFIDDAVIQVIEGMVDGPNLAVWLKEGYQNFEGTDIHVLSATIFTADFDLTGAYQGMYQVEVVNGCGSQDTSDNDLFEVTCPQPAIYDVEPVEMFEGGSQVLTVLLSAPIIDAQQLAVWIIAASDGTEIEGTGVNIVDPYTLTALFDLPYGTADDYRIKVVNGCGAETTTTNTLLGVYKLWDISFPYSANAIDICMDPTTGDFLVLFDDNTALRCYREMYYRQYSTIDLPSYMTLTRIDCNSNGNWFVGGYDGVSGNTDSAHYDAANSLINEHAPMDGYSILNDVFCMSATASNANSHGLFTSTTGATTTPYEVISYPDPNFGFGGWTLDGAIANDLFPAPGYLHGNLIVGMEADPTGDAIWTVEDNNYPYAIKWSITWLPGTISYSGVNFGDGVGDAGLYGPQDITAGKNNQMFVLDDPGTGSRIKSFNHTTGEAYIPGVAVDMTGNPTRLDGCTNNGRLAVLGVETTHWYVNIYNPGDLPG